MNVKATVRAMVTQAGAQFVDQPVPQPGEFVLAQPRVAPPDALAAQFSAAPLDRLNHSSGKSYADCARMWMREPSSSPDWVAYPEDEQAITDVLDWAQARRVAVIPYGGGSSVCGGVEASAGEDYAAVVSLDLERLNMVLEVDAVSRAARIQAGALDAHENLILRLLEVLHLEELLVGGGGVHNEYLMGALRRYFGNSIVAPMESMGRRMRPVPLSTARPSGAPGPSGWIPSRLSLGTIHTRFSRRSAICFSVARLART